MGETYHANLDGVHRIFNRESKMKDLGVQIDEKLKFDDHIYKEVNNAYSLSGVIKRNFK